MRSYTLQEKRPPPSEKASKPEVLFQKASSRKHITNIQI